MILTENGFVKIQDLKEGDNILSPSRDSINIDNETGSYSLDERSKLERTKISEVIVKQEDVVTFNSDDVNSFTKDQPIFSKLGNDFVIKLVSEVKVGDTLIQINEYGYKSEIVVEQINYSTEPVNVYTIKCEPNPWFIVGKYIVQQ